MAKTLATFQREIHSFATTGMPTAATKGVEAAAVVAKRVVVARYAAAGYGSMRLRGGRGKPIPIQVVFDVKRGSGGPEAVVQPARRSAGAARLIEDGTFKKPQGYDVRPFRYKTARGRKNAAAKGSGEAKALRTPYGPRAKIHHPPLRGHRVWNGAAEAVGPASSQAFAAQVGAELALTFG